MRNAWAPVCILMFAPIAALAQYTPPPPVPMQLADNGPRTALNGLYVELGGAAAVYSVNYERFVQEDVALRVGFGYISVSAGGTSSSGTSTASVSMITIPVTASYLGLRSGGHALELGGGAVYASFSGSVKDSSGGPDVFGSASGAVGTAIIGYRYAPVNGGFNFRIAYTPMISSGGIFNWGGISFGTLF